MARFKFNGRRRHKNGQVTLRACPACQGTPYPHYPCEDRPVRYYKSGDAWRVKLGRAALVCSGAAASAVLVLMALKAVGVL